MDETFINVDCSNPKSDPEDGKDDKNDEEETTGCMTLHTLVGCTGPEFGPACNCLKAPSDSVSLLPENSAHL